MTVINLRNSLKNELEKAFESDYPYSKTINFYEQHLPPAKKYDNDPGVLYPFILIEVERGVDQDESDDSDSTCKINFIVAVKLDDPEQHEVLTLVERIKNILRKKKYINKKYELSGALDWAVVTDETKPFEYGSVEATFIMRKISAQYEDNLT